MGFLDQPIGIAHPVRDGVNGSLEDLALLRSLRHAGESKIAYRDGESINVVDVSTGEASEVAMGNMAAWVDNDTLIVAPSDP